MTPEISNMIDQWNKLSVSDRYIFQKNIQIMDGRNIQCGLSTGTKIGTDAAQKIGFFGKTPVVQPAAIAQVSGGAVIDAEVRAAFNTLLTAMHNLGAIG